MAERKNTGIAVPGAKRLNDCYHELSEAIAARPAVAGDRGYWEYDYAALASELEGDEREAWNHRCGSRDVALTALRGAVTNANLSLWTYGPHGEAKVDRHELKELSFRTFDSGTYQPDNRRLDSAGLADSPLWVKDADWHRYMAHLWLVRYGIDWANPAPPADTLKLPPQEHFVTLSHALSWIAFGVSMDSDQLHEVLDGDSYGEHDPQEALKVAVAQLISRARAKKIELQGKHTENDRDDGRRLLIVTMTEDDLKNYRQFDHAREELRHGEGLFRWRTPQGFLDTLGFGGRTDSFIEVSVSREQLLREFRPRTLPDSQTDHLRVGHNFTRDDPANIAPWWSVNQSLAWVTTRTPSYVEYIGELEKEEPSDYRPNFVHAICESQVAESDEAKVFMETRKAAWPDGSFLAHAGRDLLGKIFAGEVGPMTQENGQGRRMRNEEFVGIGSSKTGADWLDLAPQPLFLSSEVITAFPVAELASDEVDGSVSAKLIVGVEGKCREWLADEFAADPEKRRPKGSFREAALQLFKGLSARGFNDRVWPILAQQAGRTAQGAKKKS